MNHKPVITIDQAIKLLKEKDVIILDASIDKVNQQLDNSQMEWLPNSQFFDIEGAFSDHQSSFPHTMVSAEVFQEHARKLGINKDSTVLIYDRWGIYSSPRAWWMFRYMGLNEVYVLDGGLPAWKAAGLPLLPIATERVLVLGDFEAKPQASWFIDKTQLIEKIGHPEIEIIDARSAGRFHGTAPEPREGLRSGHMPGAKNLPFDQVLDAIQYQEEAVLETIFADKITKGKKHIFTCGSGISAAIIALAAYQIGLEPISIYDGSWSEWAADSETAIVK